MLDLINNKLFLFLCRRPHSEHHIRELGRLIGISAPTVIENLRELKKKKIVKTRKVGRSILVSAELNDNFIHLKKWINVLLLVDSGLVDKISEKAPQSVILFGSYSRGEDHEKSDIDIAVDEDYSLDFTEYEKALERNIQIHAIYELRKSVIKNLRQGVLLEGVMV